VLESTGKYEEALEMYEKALAGLTRALGADHPSTLDTMNNIALVLETQGKFQEAFSIEEKVVAGRIKALGAEHPQSLKAEQFCAHLAFQIAPASGR
jgi:tetratricopeptide (TPR) repeat protein